MDERERQYRIWAKEAPMNFTLGASWDAAWDHQQQRIDAHNEHCEKQCASMRNLGLELCKPRADWHKCAYCPRQYMIEDSD